MALLGWSLDGETTIVPPEQIARVFSLDRISKNPGVFDEQKLDWICGEYFKAMDNSKFSREVLLPALEQAGILEPDAYTPGTATDFDLLSSLVKERICHRQEAADKAGYLFAPTTEELYDQKSVSKNLGKPGTAVVLEQARAALEALDASQWNAAAIDAALEPLPEQVTQILGAPASKRLVFQAIRVAVCGNQVSLPLGESMQIMGVAKTLERLDFAGRYAQPVA